MMAKQIPINSPIMYIQAVLTLLIFTYRASGAPDAPAQCDYKLVESTPENLTYQQELSFEPATTHQVYLDLINKATTRIQLASFYVYLTPSSKEHIDHPSATPGRLVLEALESAARDRQVKVEIILGFVDSTFSNQNDLERLRDAGVEVKQLDVTKLLGGGVQHAKFLIADEESFYLGSANLDWRAFTQIKELGITYTQCQELAEDLSKIFKTYSLLADKPNQLANLPTQLTTTKFNSNNPLNVEMDKVPTSVFFSAAPRVFGAENQRTDDLDAIIGMISGAKKFVYVSVFKFRSFNGRNYWPAIENALRAAVYERKVTVKLMISKDSRRIHDEELGFYRSLTALSFRNPRLGRVEIKFFKVPTDDPFHASIPYARVNHDKYMVTDNGVYIGTSNWEQDYFKNSCGVGISIKPQQIRNSNGEDIIAEMTGIFHRDYYSNYVRAV